MLSILIVNWNVRDLLRDCLGSIARGRGELEVEVIVVDSASADGSAAMVAAEFPWVTLLPQAENVGFPRGNNIAPVSYTHLDVYKRQTHRRYLRRQGLTLFGLDLSGDKRDKSAY